MQEIVTIITGASSGIGLACAREFGNRGAKLVLAARSTDKLNLIQEELEALNIDVLVVTTDVSKEEECRGLIEKAIERFGRIDVLINNAGLSMRATVEDVQISVLKRLMDVNFWGTVYCTKFALPHLLQTKGSVIGVSSVAGFIGLPARSGYSASKFAMNGFLETLRTEHIKTGLHVLIVAPGFTASNVRTCALVADGSSQGETPRKENKMMSAEKVARKIYCAYTKRKRTLILTFLEGKFAVFLNKVFPLMASKLAYYDMAKEPHSPLK